MIVNLPNNELGLLTKLQKKEPVTPIDFSTSLLMFVEEDEHVNMLWGQMRLQPGDVSPAALRGATLP